jgi:hypothetical protein
MIRLIAAVSALGVYAVVVLTSPLAMVPGLAALLPAAVAIAARWRWMAAVAAGAFLIVYTAALSIERVPPSVAPALALGLGLVIFVEAVDLSARLRGAIIEGPVIRSALGRWIGLGIGVFAAAMLAVGMAGSLAAVLPHALSPVVAAAGAFASVLILAVLVRRAG